MGRNMELSFVVKPYFTVDIDLSDELASVYVSLFEETTSHIERVICKTGTDIAAFKEKLNVIAAAQVLPSILDNPEAELLEARRYILENARINLNEVEISNLGIALFLAEGTALDIPRIYSKNIEIEKKIAIYKEVFKNLAVANTLLGQVIGSAKERSFFEESGAFIHKKGAKARSKKFNEKKREAFHQFNEGSYSSFASCADDIHKNLGVSSDTVKRWLSEMQKQHRQSPPKPQ